MKTSALICLSLFSVVSFSGCLKKGEDDPIISLRSRKARVDGDWKVVSSKYSDIYTSYNNTTANSSNVFTSDGNTFTLVYTTNNVSTTHSGTLSEEWEIDKDGTYELSTVTNGTQSTSKGRWNFTSGIGETKNKSQIAFSEESTTGANGQTTYTGNYIDEVFDIKELRNKKMVWYYHRTEKDASGFTDIEYEIELEED